ncbi:hypothetical protein AAFC00_007009 [Neodothiora populina]|uniref:Palmitoyltransferase n=1 Tax=Neodothiora populina TaxID=2781224 RepID=A0ABR3PCH6_9PEZI
MAIGTSRRRPELEKRQLQNKFAAVVVPLILVGLVSYVSWVVVALVATQYLIRGPSHYGIESRPGAGIAIIALYFVFLFLPAVTYFRLLESTRDPGYIEKGNNVESIMIEQKPLEHHQASHSCTTTDVAEPPPEDDLNALNDTSRPSSTTLGFQRPPTSSTGRSQPTSRPSTGRQDAMSGIEKPSIGSHGQSVTTLNLDAIFRGETAPPPGLEHFHSKDVFACDPNGLPIWCGTCATWKPDRSHHCNDVGRCVMKLDHFCPWVGGVVAEKNFNFFIQFTSHTALYTLYILIVMAYFFHDRSSRDFGVEGNWLATLILAAVFTLFTAGMAGTSIHLALMNTTTIDNINHASRTMYLAVYLPDPHKYYQQKQPLPASPGLDASTEGATLPRTPSPSESLPNHSLSATSPSVHSVDKTGFEPGECTRLMFHGSKTRQRPTAPKRPTSQTIDHQQPQHPWVGTITYPLYTAPHASPSPETIRAPPPRTFAILKTRPGMNPWKLDPLSNFRQVMGVRIFDWFFPVRRSPCASHTAGDTLYPLGQDYERLKAEAGITLSPPNDDHDLNVRNDHSTDKSSSRRRRHRKSRTTSHGPRDVEMKQRMQRSHTPQQRRQQNLPSSTQDSTASLTPSTLSDEEEYDQSHSEAPDANSSTFAIVNGFSGRQHGRHAAAMHTSLDDDVESSP